MQRRLNNELKRPVRFIRHVRTHSALGWMTVMCAIVGCGGRAPLPLLIPPARVTVASGMNVGRERVREPEPLAPTSRRYTQWVPSIRASLQPRQFFRSDRDRKLDWGLGYGLSEYRPELRNFGPLHEIYGEFSYFVWRRSVGAQRLRFGLEGSSAYLYSAGLSAWGFGFTGGVSMGFVFPAGQWRRDASVRTNEEGFTEGGFVGWSRGEASFEILMRTGVQEVARTTQFLLLVGVGVRIPAIAGIAFWTGPRAWRRDSPLLGATKSSDRARQVESAMAW